jgi:hypothetical protein
MSLTTPETSYTDEKNVAILALTLSSTKEVKQKCTGIDPFDKCMGCKQTGKDKDACVLFLYSKSG